MKAPSAICATSFWFLIPLAVSAQETKQCPPEQHWVRAHYRRAHTRADGTPVSASNIKAHCHDNPPSFAQWDKLTKSQKLSSKDWPHSKERQKPWTEEERERLLEALSAIPKQLWMTTVRGIYRFQRSSADSKNPAANRDGNIVLYDNAFDEGANLARIVAHELSHEYYRQMSDEKTWEYVGIADWRPVRDTKTGKFNFIPGRIDYAAEDGVESLDEDFSNNIEYFLFEPEKLRRTNPKIHAWIKNSMGDKFVVDKELKK